MSATDVFLTIACLVIVFGVWFYALFTRELKIALEWHRDEESKRYKTLRDEIEILEMRVHALENPADD